MKITKAQLNKKRRDLEKKISKYLELNKLNISFDEIKEIVYNEKGQNDLFKIFEKVKDLENIDNNFMHDVNDVWNYFPHESLDGLSPVEKKVEALEKGENKKRKGTKLTEKDWTELWGEEGPYSEVKMTTETRILDDAISRVFVVVEIVINPFTFKFCKKHKKDFKDDEMILQLLDHSKNRGFEHGYVSMAFCEELKDDNSTIKKAFMCKDYSESTVIKMHKYVMSKVKIEEKPAFIMKVK